MLRGATSLAQLQSERGCAVIRHRHLIVVVGAFLIGCAGLLMVVGCAGVRSEAPEEERGHTEATKEQGSSSGAASSEEARCGGTRTVDLQGRTYTTNDVPGCPKGGLLSGTDEQDKLAGLTGEDEVRGLGSSDRLSGGLGSDVIYGGPGNDDMEAGPAQIGSHIPPPDRSKNVLHGGPGRDSVNGDAGDDVLYGGDGDDNFI
jgi:hypothetical protein